jgi:hypothetical protein
MRVLVRSFSISIDGYGAGPDQDLQHPLGVGGPELFDWFSARARGSGCTATPTARPASTMISPRKGWKGWAPGDLPTVRSRRKSK